MGSAQTPEPNPTPTPAPSKIAGIIASIETQAAKFAPSILGGILGVEQAAKNVSGATKKQVVLNIITTAAKATEQVPNETVAAIGGMIDMFVSILNASGLFSHSNPSQPAA